MFLLPLQVSANGDGVGGAGRRISILENNLFS